MCDDVGVLIRVGFKVNRYYRCVIFVWNFGLVRNEEVKYEKNVVEECECLNGDVIKVLVSIKEGFILGIVFFVFCIR